MFKFLVGEGADEIAGSQTNLRDNIVIIYSNIYFLYCNNNSSNVMYTPLYSCDVLYG